VRLPQWHITVSQHNSLATDHLPGIDAELNLIIVACPVPSA
jgi:hypothetical protein